MGERDEWALSKGVAGGGFHEFPDLSPSTSRDHVQALANNCMTGQHAMKIAIFVGQMWAMRNRVKEGDLIVLPLKTTKKIAIGVCTSRYRYLADQPESRRHVIGVEWRRTDVPRSAFKDDLLNTLNGSMTVFSATRNEAGSRLRKVLEGGMDPGSIGLAIVHNRSTYLLISAVSYRKRILMSQNHSRAAAVRQILPGNSQKNLK